MVSTEFVMSLLKENPVQSSDESLLDGLKSTVANLSPAGRRKLLARIAREFLAVESDIVLKDETGEVFGHVRSAKRVTDPLMDFTKEELAAINRNLSDPKNSMPWQEMLAQLDREHEEKERARTLQPAAVS
jgi:hypothetical protein